MFGWLFGKGRRPRGQPEPRDNRHVESRDLAYGELIEFLAGTLEDVAAVCGLQRPVLAGAERRVSVVGYVAGFVDAALQEVNEKWDEPRIHVLEQVFSRLFGAENGTVALSFFKELKTGDDAKLIKAMVRGGTEFQGIDDDPDPLAGWSKVCVLVKTLSDS